MGNGVNEMGKNKQYDMEFKVQALKLAKEIGGGKAAKELGMKELGSSISLYFCPLVLKNRLRGRPLFSCQERSSCSVGLSSLMSRTVTAIPWSESHFSAFLQVVQRG